MSNHKEHEEHKETEHGAVSTSDLLEDLRPETLALEWRTRAKYCDYGDVAKAFLWAADDLESALRKSRDQSAECRRVLNSDLPSYKQLDELRTILFSNTQLSKLAENEER